MTFHATGSVRRQEILTLTPQPLKWWLPNVWSDVVVGLLLGALLHAYLPVAPGAVRVLGVVAAALALVGAAVWSYALVQIFALRRRRLPGFARGLPARSQAGLERIGLGSCMLTLGAAVGAATAMAAPVLVGWAAVGTAAPLLVGAGVRGAVLISPLLRVGRAGTQSSLN